MSQFSLFDEPQVDVTPPPAVAPLVQLKHPPAIVRAGAEIEANALNLRPLKAFNADWLEVRITDAQFNAARAQYGMQVSDDYVMLQVLADSGVRCKTNAPTNLAYLYDYVIGPFVIRKRTEPGFAVTCRQAPTQEKT